MTYSVGIIGTGFGSKVHLPALQHHSKFDVEIIAGRKEEKTQSIADEAGINASTDWRELLDMNLDIITVSTPPYWHFEMGKSVLNAGKHLLLEKPTTSTALQARKLVQIAEENDLIGMMCHEFRWTPYRRYFSHIINHEKLIGDIREIHVRSFFSFAASSETPQFSWLWNSIYDGGLLGAAGSHGVDHIRNTTKLEFKEVMGRTYTRVDKRKDGDKYRKVTADDSYSFLFELENDVFGEVVNSGTMSPAPPSSFIVAGDEGTAYLQGKEISFGKTDDEFQILDIPEKFQLDETLGEKDRRIPPFLKLLDQFYTSLENGESLSPSLKDGWRNQQVLDAVRRSHSTGSRIEIVDYL